MSRVTKIKNDEDLIKILPLIQGYQAFYKAHASDEANFEHFRKYLDDKADGALFAAWDKNGEAEGFATLYFLPSSLSARPYCVLNDLFVSPNTRSKGVARKILKGAVEFARARGFTDMEWITQKENARAQRLYDKLPQTKSEWIMYSADLIKLESSL